MKKLTALIMMAAICAFAQTNPPTFIRGSMNIQFNSKTQTDSSGKPKIGVVDNYQVNVNVCNSTVFRGGITATPLVMGGMFSSVQQASSLNFDMHCDVVNPANTSQTKEIGRIYGIVPIDLNGVYRFDDGTLQIAINQIGSARDFTAKFKGLAAGKPPVKARGLLDTLQKEVMNVSKQVQGKTVTVQVKKYDLMKFQNFVLAGGPVQIYPDVTVNGEMIYDYDRGAWYFKDLTINYTDNGRQLADRISGSILWVEKPDRKTTGLGEYDFDVRVNEPAPSEASVFAGAADEAAFFTSDATIPGLTGTMKYKDTLRGGDTIASDVAIDLTGNKLTKQQAMCLCKLLVFSAIVPMNSD
jgi:hypothetical protein